MDTYSFLRQLADSWVLLMLFLFFLGVIGWAFRPGSRPLHDDAAQSIFGSEDAPRACNGSCATCACAAADDKIGDAR
ncbi:Cbb3-type cytochrome oxidase, subunit 3 [Roseivivax halotolerans]|uniref:Cbb3-type cytochrome oxidase, subunit 3 n=1 Tax=Roseivivax halotolerans TaxID=93684 RepID=A0A1I5ZEQ9_9RHOB|nr:cbb3-type cytochrome c oxidase subunit 3 [Roseivivax halotolerans]SFQ54910.1 Cbb3-type cytochrome oxidase, subunit 3 [Roseivivax halotolerans]